MYAILGATGHTGRAAAERLLANGEKVRAIGRDPKKLEALKQQGAEIAVADATDAEALAKAFSGAEAAYVLIPPAVAEPDVAAYQRRVIDALASAISKSGVKRVVALSSVGADKPDKTGVVLGLHRLEEKLKAIDGLNAVFLRAGYFMENTLAQAGVIPATGMMAGPVKGDLKLSLIYTRDIGEAAAAALLDRKLSGKHAKELLGQRDLSYSEIAKIVGKAIGKPDLAYAQLPNGQLKPILMQMGMSNSMVDLLLEMTDAMNSGYMKPLESRSAENSNPTSFETFVNNVFVPAFKGKAAAQA